MGSDARTPLGAGNLSLVAGGLSFHNTNGTTFYRNSQNATFQKMKLTLGAPIPSLSPAGLAAAAALVLLAAGYAMRRRLRAEYLAVSDGGVRPKTSPITTPAETKALLSTVE